MAVAMRTVSPSAQFCLVPMLFREVADESAWHWSVVHAIKGRSMNCMALGS